MELKGKTVVITGSAMGIGKACAEALKQAGCNIVIADINEAEGRKTAEELDGLFVRTDISDEEQVRALREAAMKEYGRIDIVVNNAALQTEAPFAETTVRDFRRVVDINLNGTFIMMSVMSEVMEKGSTILNMLSVHYEQPRLNKFGYDASKAGIAILTKEAALALSEKGITVNGISYGAVRTPMNASWMDDPEKSAHVRKNIPLGWIGEAEEIGEYARTIIETFSDHATGSIFTIDGGRRLK